MQLVCNIMVCMDCTMFLANGTDDLDEKTIARIERGLAIEQRDGAHVVCSSSEETDNEFSWSPCDLCGSRLGGSRHQASILKGE